MEKVALLGNPNLCYWLLVDLANGSSQSGSGLTYTDSGQKRDYLKWVTQPMTFTRSFKGWVKIGLTRIFTHEKIYT